MRVLRALLRGALMLLMVVVAVALWAGWRLWMARPQLSGTVRVSGVSAPVDLVRDLDGVVHVRAATEVDAAFGLGYAHAQDRLWQMEFQRRLAAGRLAEVLGPEALPTDRLFRVLGLVPLARAQVQKYRPETRALLDGYVAGVNALVSSLPPRRLPAEFAILGIAPAPWRADDVVAYTKVIALGLSTNFPDELFRARLVARVGRDGAAALMPASTAGTPIVLPEPIAPASPPASAPVAHSLPAAPELARAYARLGAIAAPFAAGIAASNNWVVSGARTATGKPLLANDPHLGTQAPSTWYLAHLEGGALDVIGGTFPGVPGVAIGHNARIAWGATNVMADNEDLFVEHVNERNEAEFQGTWEPMTLRHETIAVKGQARPERLTVRITRHGPLVSDVLPGMTTALALRWTGLDPDDRMLEAFLGAARASNWREFTDAFSQLTLPMQNLVYADVDGNIGYFAPGAVPVRAQGDGTIPVPGWTGDHEWTGYVPRESMPAAFNPSRGFVVTANNPIFPDDVGPFISTNWEPGYRAARATELLEAAERVGVAEFARMQADTRPAQVKTVLPWLRRARPEREASRSAMSRLATWDGTLREGSPESAIYEAWSAATARRLFDDELGPALAEEYSRLPQWESKALHRLIVESDDRWCDDMRTPEPESCETTLALALDDAVERLTSTWGVSPDRWRWAEDNVVRFPHRPFDAVRALRVGFSRTARVAGDAFTINPVMHVRDATVTASYRQIVDLANLDASRFVLTLGQSGVVFDPRYDDFLSRWRRVEYVPMRFSRAAVDAAISARLTLTP